MTIESGAAAVEAAAEEQTFEQAFTEFAGDLQEPEVVTEQEPTEGAEIQAVGDATQNPEAAVTEEKDEGQLAAALEAAKSWEHKFKSEVGRQTAMQRRIQELEAKLNSKPTEAAQTQFSEGMKALIEEYPELGVAINKELQEQLSAVRDEVKKTVAPILEKDRLNNLQEELKAVRNKHPGFEETVKSQEFVDWFQTQPEAVKSLAASPYASDTIAVLDYFSAARRPDAASAQILGIQKKREQALARNVSIRGATSAPIKEVPDDFEAAFQHFARKKN